MRERGSIIAISSMPMLLFGVSGSRIADPVVGFDQSVDEAQPIRAAENGDVSRLPDSINEPSRKADRAAAIERNRYES